MFSKKERIMVSKIRFKNFKLFKNWQELEIKPITILIGKNNSGKTALLKLPVMIGESLKGIATTQISISGSGSGANKNDAINNANENMHKLQTILITGSLPYKLEIVKLDTISPSIGKGFLSSIFIAGLCSIIYELLISATATYFLGDGVRQFSILIGVYLFSMGIGAYFSKFFKHKPIHFFIKIVFQNC